MGLAMIPQKRKDSSGTLESVESLNGALSDDMFSDSGDDPEDASVEKLSGSISSGEEDEFKNSDGDNDLKTGVDGFQYENYRIVQDANGNERFEYSEIDPVYDSDDSDARDQPNTIGNIPLSFYDSYPHIGYDINGKKIMRPATGEALDALLDSIEVPKGWTGLTDPQTGKPLNLSQDELELLRRLQMGEVPENGFDPYPVSHCPCASTRLTLTLFSGNGAIFHWN